MPTKKNVIRWLSLCSLALVATVGWADQETRTVSIGAGSLTFRPPHTRGDKEFKGHGPNIKADFVVSVSEDRKKIMAKIYMKAEEWDSDEDDRPQTGAKALVGHGGGYLASMRCWNAGARRLYGFRLSYLASVPAAQAQCLSLGQHSDAGCFVSTSSLAYRMLCPP